MKVCVIGAGAIGGLLAVRLALAGQEVCVVARGANLEAIARDGLRLQQAEDQSEVVVRLRATAQMAEVGACDLVILGMKAHQVAPVVEELPVLFHAGTVVLTAQNGIPWWYFLKHGGPHEGAVLQSVDPGGFVRRHLPVERVLGAVVYPAAERVAPGVLRHMEGNRFSLGEVDNSDTPRVRALSEALREAGFKAPVVSDIRAELWTKLWGNLSFNPISALTQATLGEICRFPAGRELAAQMMAEAQAVAESLGIRFKVSLEKRMAGAEAVGEHKTSMLQDVEQGRPLELAALVGAVSELGRLTGVATPHIDAIHAAASLLAHTLQAHRGRLRLAPTE